MCTFFFYQVRRRLFAELRRRGRLQPCTAAQVSGHDAADDVGGDAARRPFHAARMGAGCVTTARA